MQKLTQQVVYLYIKFTLLFHSLGYWFRLRKARLIYKSGVSKQRSVLTPAKVKMFSRDLVMMSRFLARVTATYSKFHSSSENDSKKEKGKKYINTQACLQKFMFSSKHLLLPTYPTKSIKICWLHKWLSYKHTNSRNKQNLTRQGTQDLECLLCCLWQVLGACSLVTQRLVHGQQ